MPGQHLAAARRNSLFCAAAGVAAPDCHDRAAATEETAARSRRPFRVWRHGGAAKLIRPAPGATRSAGGGGARAPRLPHRGRASDPVRIALGLFLGDQFVALGGDLAQAAQHAARAGRDEPADDDVLLEAFQRVDLAVDGGVGQHARRLLERGRRDERAGLQRGLGDAEQNRRAGRRPLARLLERAIDARRTRSGRSARP